jgi:anti-sigma factor RsiW
MNCQLTHERIVAAAYNELADGEQRELELHLDGCPECREEQRQLLALMVQADAHPVLEPEANLIARSRQRLEATLDALPPRRWYDRLSQWILNNFASLQAAPVAVCLLLLLGVGAGSLGGYQLAEKHAARTTAAQQALAPQVQQTEPASTVQAGVATTAEIANISSIVRQPNSHIVEVRYNQMVPQRIEGSLDDPAIRELLMLASQNPASAVVRDDSVGLLAAECTAGHGCKAAGIRDALLVALRHDKNAGVREKALKGLESYVSEDVRVRNAVLEALMNDTDPKIRTAAISLLQPVEGDTSVRQVLHSVANTDRNPYIRNVSRQVLSNVPEMEIQ